MFSPLRRSGSFSTGQFSTKSCLFLWRESLVKLWWWIGWRIVSLVAKSPQTRQPCISANSYIRVFNRNFPLNWTGQFLPLDPTKKENKATAHALTITGSAISVQRISLVTRTFRLPTIQHANLLTAYFERITAWNSCEGKTNLKMNKSQLTECTQEVWRNMAAKLR